MDIRKFIRQILNEHLLFENVIHATPEEVPAGVREWVKSISSRHINRYKIIQNQTRVHISTPWHISDSTTYQFFKLTPDGNAVSAGEGLKRRGYESESPQGHQEGMDKEGYVDIPEGFILVEYGTYPPRVEIYAGPGAQLMIQDANAYSDMGDEELVALYAAKGLKPAYRPKFSDEVYKKLMERGFMNANKSITVQGRNVIEDTQVKARLKDIREKSGGKYYFI